MDEHERELSALTLVAEYGLRPADLARVFGLREAEARALFLRSLRRDEAGCRRLLRAVFGRWRPR